MPMRCRLQRSDTGGQIDETANTCYLWSCSVGAALSRDNISVHVPLNRGCTHSLYFLFCAEGGLKQSVCAGRIWLYNFRAVVGGAVYHA